MPGSLPWTAPRSREFPSELSSRRVSAREEKLTAELEAQLVKRLSAEWEGINETFFRGALRRPLLLLSDTKARVGQWQPTPRTLEISRHLVLAHAWGEVVEVLKHEVAHQFVDECLAVDEPPHGPTFRSICERLGIRGAPSLHLEGAPASTADDPQWARRVARIRKLLALATSPNQHEAENAASAAQRMMLRFNVEMDEIEERPGYGFRHLGQPSGRIFEYQRRVARILDTHFFVEAIWVPVYRPREAKRGSVLEVCGAEPNLVMAEYVHDFVHGTAARLWKDYKRRARIRSNRDRHGFLAGVMDGFEAKLDAQRSELREEGLVWVPLADLDRFFRRRHPYVRRVRGAGTLRTEAFSEGQRAGGDIVLSRPVNERAAPRQPRAIGPRRRSG